MQDPAVEIDWEKCIRCIDDFLPSDYVPVVVPVCHPLISHDRAANVNSMARYADMMAYRLYWCPDASSVAAFRATACIIQGAQELYNMGTPSVFPLAAMVLWWHRKVAAMTTGDRPYMLVCPLSALNEVMKGVSANAMISNHRRAFIGKQRTKTTQKLHSFYFTHKTVFMTDEKNLFSAVHTAHVVAGILHHSQVVCNAADPDTPVVSCNLDIPDVVFMYTNQPTVHSIYGILLSMYQHHRLDRTSCFNQVLSVLNCDFPCWNRRTLNANDRNEWNLAFPGIDSCASVADEADVFAKTMASLDHGWIDTEQHGVATLWDECNLTDRMTKNPSMLQQYKWLKYHYAARIVEIPEVDRSVYCKQLKDNNIRSTFGRHNDRDNAGIVGFVAFLFVVSKYHISVPTPVQDVVANPTDTPANAVVAVQLPPNESVVNNSIEDARRLLLSESVRMGLGPDAVVTALAALDGGGAIAHRAPPMTDPKMLLQAASQLEAVSTQINNAVSSMHASIGQLRNETVDMLEAYMSKTTSMMECDAATLMTPEVAMRTKVINMVAVSELCMRQFFGSIPQLIDEHMQRVCVLSAATADTFSGLMQTHGVPNSYCRPWLDAPDRYIADVSMHGMPLQSAIIPETMAEKHLAVMKENETRQHAVRDIAQSYQHLGAQSLAQYMNSRELNGDDTARRLFVSAVGESVAQPLLNRMFDVHHPSLSVLCPSVERDPKLHLRVSSGLFASTILHTHHHLQLMYTTTPLTTFTEIGVACGLSRPDLWVSCHRICDIFYRHICRDISLNMLAGQVTKVTIFPGNGTKMLLRLFLLHRIGCCRTCQTLSDDDTKTQFCHCPDTLAAVAIAGCELEAPRMRRIFNAMPPCNMVGAIQYVLHEATSSSTASPMDVTDFHGLRRQIPELESSFMTIVEETWPDISNAWKIVPLPAQTLRAYPLALRGLMVTAVHLYMREEHSPIPNYAVRNYMYESDASPQEVSSSQNTSKNFIRKIYDTLYTEYPVYHSKQECALPPDDTAIGNNTTLDHMILSDKQEGADMATFDVVVPPQVLQFMEAVSHDKGMQEQWAPQLDRLHRTLYEPAWTTSDVQTMAANCGSGDLRKLIDVEWTQEDSTVLSFSCPKWLSPDAHPPPTQFGREGRTDRLAEPDGYCTDVDPETDVHCILRHYIHTYGQVAPSEDNGVWERCAEAARVFAVMNPSNSRPGERDARVHRTSDGDNAFTQNADALFAFERSKKTRPDGWDAESDAFAKRHKTYL